MPFCSKCGSQLKEDDKFCPNCGTRTTQDPQTAGYQAEAAFESNTSTGYHRDRGAYYNPTEEFSHLSAYYQGQFSRIKESNEMYKGKWNWAAFLFGPIWAFTKGLWLSALIALVGAFLTSGIIGFIYWIIYGIRGNYMYYTLVTKKKQLPF
ncbi:MAG TPA: zinc-ribbon domain-containing protein [Clostridia bacterium]|nr:zinc-ribbon domain-containing protein [Clostridia bacterium]HRU41783.1 zinc-ribbon domain-containing protein [Candidatus Diapherotrites archaeon]